MKLNKLALLFLLTSSATQAAFVISQLTDPALQGSAGTGQSFTPSVGMADNPGSSTATIDLASFSLWSAGGSDKGDVSNSITLLDTVFLLIYEGAPAFTGSTGAFVPTNLVGASTNSIDHNPNVVNGTELVWTFNNLTLDYTTTYFAAIASNTTGSLGLNDVGIGFRSSSLNPYAGGNALANGFAVQSVGDLKFTATFANPVPEPATALIGSIGILTLLRRRRM
jgi:hypothetical protein